MSYTTQAQAELHAIFDGLGIDPVVEAAVIDEILKMLLQSYRNGQAAGPKPRRQSSKTAPAQQ